MILTIYKRDKIEKKLYNRKKDIICLKNLGHKKCMLQKIDKLLNKICKIKKYAFFLYFFFLYLDIIHNPSFSLT